MLYANTGHPLHKQQAASITPTHLNTLEIEYFFIGHTCMQLQPLATFRTSNNMLRLPSRGATNDICQLSLCLAYNTDTAQLNRACKLRLLSHDRIYDQLHGKRHSPPLRPIQEQTARISPSLPPYIHPSTRIGASTRTSTMASAAALAILQRIRRRITSSKSAFRCANSYPTTQTLFSIHQQT